MEKVVLEFDDELLIQPKLHDAEILELVQFDFKNQIFGMKLQTEDGQDLEIWFKGVKHLTISDFFHQNIVFGISVYRDEKISEEYKKLINEFCYADKDISKLMNIEFDSAAGATISMICENMEIFQDNKK